MITASNATMTARRITVGTIAAMMTGAKFDEDEEDDDATTYPEQN